MSFHRRLAAAVALALACCVAATDVRGLPRSLSVAYEGAEFKCLDGSKVVAASAVNDDFCDCKDGSDEPGTPACPNGKFFCANKGYRGKFVSSSLVNDGVCDCCDGSDELGSPRSGCKNTCDADGAEWRKQQADAIQRAEMGARLREEYASTGRAAAAARTAKLSSATAALEKARAEKAAAEAAAVDVLAEEKRVGEEKARAAAAAAEASLVASLHLADLDRAALVTLLIEHVRETNSSEALVARLRARGTPGSDSITWSDPAGEAGISTEYKSDAGNAARARLEAATAEESKQDADVKAATDEGAVDFGPDAVFYKLKGQCYELRVNQYTYHTCPFGSAKQDVTSLGHFSGWSTHADGSTDYSTMSFKGGQMCWNGPERSFKLVFECGAVDALLSADEPEKCTYVGRFSTPAVCDAKFAQELRWQLDAAGEVVA